MPDMLSPSVLKQGLREAVTDVLEKMFFIRILEDPQAAGTVPAGEVECRADPRIAVCVSFHGRPSGRFSLLLDSGAARSIAGDFLGEEDPELEPQQVEEVVCELANMICGAVLSRVESTITFRLDAPLVVNSTDSEASQPETAMHAFPIGNGELTAKIWMEDPICGSTEKSAS